MTEAEKLADAILKAAGSGLQHYTMPGTREAILKAASDGIREAQGKRTFEVEAKLLELDFETGEATFAVPNAEWFAGSYKIIREAKAQPQHEAGAV